MAIQDKVERLIVRLTQGTYEDEVTWNVENPPSGLTDSSGVNVPLYLSAIYREKTFGIYLYRTKIWVDDIKYEWCEGEGFCLVDNQRVLWEYKEVSPNLYNLFEAARIQVSHIEDVIDSLLDEPDIAASP